MLQQILGNQSQELKLKTKRSLTEDNERNHHARQEQSGPLAKNDDNNIAVGNDQSKVIADLQMEIEQLKKICSQSYNSVVPPPFPNNVNMNLW